MVKVRVPASSANLGPGFDCFGIAWQCYNEMKFEKSDEVIITGCPEEYRNADNMAYQAFMRTLKEAGKEAKGLEIHFGKTDIPVSRGLGSSAALISGAVMAANALYDLGFSKERLFEIATDIEGHPDNVAPAMFGDFTVSAMSNGKPVTRHFPVNEKLTFCCMVPDFELRTSLARSVLPATYEKPDALFNISRSALLIRAIGDGDTELLKIAMEDRIHEPYRYRLIEGVDKAREMALSAGAAAMCISGAGSTLLAIGDNEAFYKTLSVEVPKVFPGWKVMKMILDRNGGQIV